MSERVSMPALGESVTEGTVTRWLKSVGDSVEVDEPLLEVSTDKVDTEIPSPVAGVLQEILAEEDETVEVGADLCVVGDGEAGSGSDEGGDSADASQESEQPQAEEPEQDEEPQQDEEPEQAAPQQESSSQDEPSGGGSSDGGSSEGETVTMPALGESVTEGTVTRWLKSEGDTVEVDEPLLEVSTDKVDTEIPSPVAGVLTKIIAAEDDTVEVGGELAVIGGSASGSGGSSEDAAEKDEKEDEQPQQDQAQSKDSDSGSEESEESGDLAEEARTQEKAAQDSAEKSGGSGGDDADDSGVAVGVGTTTSENGTTSHKDADGDGTADAQQQADAPRAANQDVSAYVTPLVRKLASQHGVDLGSLQGTGVGGRIRKQDVLDAAAKAKEEPPAPAAEEKAPAAEEKAPAVSAPSSSAAPSGDSKRGSTEKMSRLRKVIAARMVESLQTSAQLTTVIEVDVTRISRMRRRVKDEFLQREGTKLSFMPFFAMAAIEALKEHPIVNASVEDDSIVYHAAEHLGVAVDTPRGLLVPVIKDAGDLNIAGLARKIADLAARTRDNKVTPDELSGGTFTLTNTGSRGALFDTPIINQPNVGILGTGAVVKRPVVITDEDGMETIAIRDMVYLAISYDHRVVDGADAARFLSTMKERLEEAHFEV
ncbi:2-oxoglutarate dehydrogenase, E2 component, dihydrolipoamide succinyltransferase [Serinicoccus sp. LYQ131]|uniref:2-oxoglutarate dehydrogenase, E2 component, dihydrolipoamide succinyltransferase n=1 Tax=Serinicoccus sp. LYQ131 TaxID=3378797 RepID=UPI00385219AB